MCLFKTQASCFLTFFNEIYYHPLTVCLVILFSFSDSFPTSPSCKGASHSTTDIFVHCPFKTRTSGNLADTRRNVSNSCSFRGCPVSQQLSTTLSQQPFSNTAYRFAFPIKRNAAHSPSAVSVGVSSLRQSPLSSSAGGDNQLISSGGVG